MKLSNKTYDFLKKFVMIYAPSLIAFYAVVANTLGWADVHEVVTIANAFVAMLGTMLGISTKNYYASSEEDAE